MKPITFVSILLMAFGCIIMIFAVVIKRFPIDPAAGEKHQWQNWGAATDIHGESFRQFRHCETCNAAQARTIRY